MLYMEGGEVKADDVTVPEWKKRTTKLLNRTALFDSSTAIIFVAEGKGTDTIEQYHNSLEDKSGILTGEQASSFYKEVISTKSSATPSSKPLVHDKLSKHSRKKHNSNRSTVTSGLAYKAPSTAQLFKYAQEGNVDELRRALESGECDVNTLDDYSWSLLMCSASAGHKEIVQLLLDQGAQWRNVKDRRGNNAPGLARISGHEELAQLIENHGVKILSCLCSHKASQSSLGGMCVPTDPFYCNVCKQMINSSTKTSHNVSTSHQFSCQHKPNVSKYLIPQTNRGYQMMLRSGWDPEGGLGSEGKGRTLPVKTVLKRDRFGIGASESKRARVTHFTAHDSRAIKRKGVKESRTSSKKKEREQAMEQERDWEIRIRRYMNTN